MTSEELKRARLLRDAVRVYIRAQSGRQANEEEEQTLKELFPIKTEVPRIVSCGEYDYRFYNERIEFRENNRSYTPPWKPLYGEEHNKIFLDLVRNPTYTMEE